MQIAKTTLRAAFTIGAVLLLTAAPARAADGEKAGFYAVASGALVHSDCCDDDSAFGGGVFAGYRFNENIGGEVGYARVGDFDARTFSFTGIARTPAGSLGDIFFRAGLHSWKQEGISGTDPVLGGGFENALSENIGLRSELIYYIGDVYDFSAVSMGLVVRF